MSGKDLTINIKGQLIDFAVPKVMAIVNITPDSFYSHSRSFDDESIKKRILDVIEEGTDIIDLGGCSTRPGATDISEEEEIRRLERGLQIIRAIDSEVILSVDTWRAEVARKCIEDWGADIINDVSGGSRQPEIFDVIAQTGAVYILTHSRAVPATMDSCQVYDDVTAEVISELSKTVDRLRQMKIKDIIIDPGFGFAKNPVQSLQLLDELNEFCKMGMPVLAGLSRKSMIWKTLSTSPEESYEGTIALNAIALDRGANILRVHDVRGAKEAVKLITEMKKHKNK